MYHDGKPDLERRLLFMLAAAVLAVAALWGLQHRIDADVSEQSAIALENMVVRAAVQCYAVEGAYPQSLDYLEAYYGLQVNHKTYIVSYEVFASNRLPDVLVLARQ